MDTIRYAYRLDFVFVSTDEIGEQDLAEMGIEVKDALTSFLRAKGYKMRIDGEIDISIGGAVV